MSANSRQWLRWLAPAAALACAVALALVSLSTDAETATAADVRQAVTQAVGARATVQTAAAHDRFTFDGLKMFIDQDAVADYGGMIAMSLVALLPVLAFFVAFQRYLIDGMATSGLKG